MRPEGQLGGKGRFRSGARPGIALINGQALIRGRRVEVKVVRRLVIHPRDFAGVAERIKRLDLRRRHRGVVGTGRDRIIRSGGRRERWRLAFAFRIGHGPVESCGIALIADVQVDSALHRIIEFIANRIQLALSFSKRNIKLGIRRDFIDGQLLSRLRAQLQRGDRCIGLKIDFDKAQNSVAIGQFMVIKLSVNGTGSHRIGFVRVADDQFEFWSREYRESL